jgi:hypothetical protein
MLRTAAKLTVDAAVHSAWSPHDNTDPRSGIPSIGQSAATHRSNRSLLAHQLSQPPPATTNPSP